MATLIYQLLSVAAVLGAVEITSGYTFKNCIEKSFSRKRSFNCIRRKEKDLRAIVGDLPESAVNLTVSINQVSHIPAQCFAHLPNLRHLRIDHNHLRIIDASAFQNLHKLKFLNLSFNYISELNPSVFQHLPNLTFLSLTNNKLKQLPEGIFSPLLHLGTLLLRQNFLTNFSTISESLSNLRHLKLLDLCFNNLTSLTHANVSLPVSLKTLYVCRNDLSALACEHSFLKEIRVLDLSYNSRLPTMAFQHVDLSQVTYLRLRSTSVRVLEFLNHSNINARHVDFSGTGLKNNSLLIELCKVLKRREKWINNLHLSANGIKYLTKYILSYCPRIEMTLDLSHNELKYTSCLKFLNGQRSIKVLNTEHNHLTKLPSCNTGTVVPLHRLEELSYRYNRILLVNAFAFNNTPNIKTLQLNINTIAFLHRKALKGLKMLQTLRLDNNLLTDLFYDTFEDQVNLQILNLRNNRIAVIFNKTFLNLNNLTTLDLGGNKITHFEPLGLEGLKSLSKFYLDGNNLKRIDTSLYPAFHDTLTVLDLQRNQIRFLYENVSSPFVNLRKLGDLKLDRQRPYGLTLIPRAFFRGLHSLKSLYLTNNQLVYLAPDAFDDLTGLRFLTLENCCTGVVQLQPGIFKGLKNLTKLIVENTGIQNFSKEIFGNLTQLVTLQLNHNVMHSIDTSVLESLPKLHYLDLRNTPLSCTCKNSLLQNWTVNNTKVQVVFLYNLPCQNDEKHSFYNFSTNVCYIDLGEYLFLSTAVVIFLFTVTPLLYVKLYWKVKYGYYVFRSWCGEQWRRLREEEENCIYDAFISYNSSDEEWVMEQLLPNLEGNLNLKLCLHHRDFELGRDIVDNIVTAVYSSRKTVCIVSRSFLQSEWCSLEIQLASYRLFDEHRDVLLLVFLEPITERQMSSYHRMRKVMLKKTYLQWPGSDCVDPAQAQELFWNHLRRAIGMTGKPEAEKSDAGEDGGTLDGNETAASETHTSDASYLLP